MGVVMSRILVYGLSQGTLGGIETFLLTMNKHMSDDIIFDYVIEGKKTIHQSEIDKKGGLCFFISPKKTIFKNIRDWSLIFKKLKAGYDTIYFNLYSLAWIIPILIALKYKYKVVVHAHNNKLHNCGPIQKILHALNRIWQKHLSIIRLTNSSQSAKFFFGNKESILINCAIDVSKFSFSNEARSESRSALGIQKENHVYGFSGRLSFQKDPLYLIRVFSEIRKIDEKAVFLICGDGDLKHKVEKKAKSLGINVIMTGSVREMFKMYSAMDVFVLPTRFEGLGIVLIEAQANGLPCLTTEKVVPKEVEITDNIVFLPKKHSVRRWAIAAFEHVDKKIDRSVYSTIVSDTCFNVSFEAKKLETLLLSKEMY